MKNEELVKVGNWLDMWLTEGRVMRATVIAFDEDFVAGPVVVVQDGGGDFLRLPRTDILEVRVP